MGGGGSKPRRRLRESKNGLGAILLPLSQAKKEQRIRIIDLMKTAIMAWRKVRKIE